MIKISFSIFFLILVISCRPEPIEVELNKYEPQIVVASQVVPNYVMMIGLTRSFTVLSNAGYQGAGDSATFADLLIDSALVTIESQGGVDTLFLVSPGLYGSLKKLENSGGAYHLKVIDYDLNQTATAISIMKENVALNSVITSLNVEDGDTSININLDFKDVANESNFYVLSVYSRNSNKGVLDVNNFFDNGSNNIEYQELIEDKNKDGNIFEREINLKSVSTKDSLMVLLSNISEGYYDFLESRERSGNFLSEITNEPVNYPSNVNNGIGYFNTHYPSIRFFDLKDLLD